MNTHTDPSSPPVMGRLAATVAESELLPVTLRSVLGYYADTGVFDYESLRIKRHVDRTIEGVLSAAFGAIERTIADATDVDPAAIEFSYETKLTMPAELTLGRVYQRAIAETPNGFDPVTQQVKTPLAEYVRRPLGRGSETKDVEAYRDEYVDTLAEIERAERMTELVVEALLDGDMRDAINDDEYEDFDVAGPVGDVPVERLARTAQACLARRVEATFEQFPDGVRDAYDHAVAVSERHQDADPRFRELAELATAGDPDAARLIREEYKHVPFEERPSLFAADELDIPYLKTQYGRVGVIYDGMIEMYREAGIGIDTGFEKSIVLAIIGAQIWLDDVDDFEQDLTESQLTPVTAEYWLTTSEREAYDRIVEITVRYLDLAKRAAVESDSTLTGIAIEYILRSGEPESLPGSDGAE